MTLMLAIGIPVLLIFGGAMLAFSFASSSEEPEQATAQEQPSPLVTFQPTAWSSEARQVPVEEIVANIEQHLRQEHKAASRFAREPSHHSLHLD